MMFCVALSFHVAFLFYLVWDITHSSSIKDLCDTALTVFRSVMLLGVQDFGPGEAGCCV